MSIAIIKVASASFRTDEQSDKLNKIFMERIGVGWRYVPARLAISRSLSIPSSVETISDRNDGKAIKGDTLFGTGATLLVWVSLIIEHAGDHNVDIDQFGRLVANHWRRGIALLDEEWEQSEGDVTKFVNRLVDVAELPRTGSHTISGSSRGHDDYSPAPESTITVPIGEISEDSVTTEKILWNLNGAGGSPHSALMGGVGSGKTRTAVAMLKNIRQQVQVPMIAFDFKGDLGADGYHVEELFDADEVSPPHSPIPLNVLAMYETSEIDIAQAASRFREAFENIKGKLGEKQADAIHEAASIALKSHEVCTLKHIQDALIGVYEEREAKDDGAISTMREICRFPLFEPKLSPADFFQRSYLIKLPSSIPSEIRKLVVNLILNALDQYLNSLSDTPVNADGARGLRVLCMIDEAHQIFKQKLPALSNLMRMSRSKGGAVMLISQSPDDFSGVEDDFLSEMGLVVAFSTNASPKNVARILGKKANLTALKVGQCFIKRREDQSSKRVLAWSKKNQSDTK